MGNVEIVEEQDLREEVAEGMIYNDTRCGKIFDDGGVVLDNLADSEVSECARIAADLFGYARVDTGLA